MRNLVKYSDAIPDEATAITQGVDAVLNFHKTAEQQEDMAAWRISGAEETYRMYLVYRKDTYLSRPFQYFIDLAVRLDAGM